jgi:hypothetical protein
MKLRPGTVVEFEDEAEIANRTGAITNIGESGSGMEPQSEVLHGYTR